MKKIKHFLIKYKFFIRLTITVLFAATIPIIIFNRNMMNHTYRDTVIKNNNYYAGITANMRLYSSEQMALMRNTSIKLGYEKRIVRQTVEAHNYNYILAIKELENYRRFIPSSAEMFLYFKNADYVLSSKAKYGKNFLISYLAGGDDYLKNRINGLFTDNISINMVSNFETASAVNARLLISMPVNEEIIAVFSVTRDSLGQFFLGALNDEQKTGLMIYNGDGELILSNAEFVGSIHNDPEFTPFLLEYGLNRKDFIIDGTAFSFYKNAGGGMIYVLAIKHEHLLQTINSLYTYTDRITVITIMLLTLLLLTTIYMNYRPLLKLSKRFIRPDGTPRGELDILEYTIQQFKQENESMNEQLSGYGRILMDFIFHNLVYGLAPPVDKFLEFEAFGRMESYFIIVTRGIKFTVSESETTAKEISDERGIFIYITGVFHEHYIFVLCGLNTGSYEERSRTARYIFETFSDKTDSVLTIGVGKAVSILPEIKNSYFGALTAVESCSGGLAMIEDMVNKKPSPDNKKNELAASFIKYVDEHFTDPNISLNRISDEFKISIYVISRLFKESAGVGYKEYITGKRIDFSKRLLLTTDKNINDIARLSGFTDVANFNKLFKSICGVTPSAFRLK